MLRSLADRQGKLVFFKILLKKKNSLWFFSEILNESFGVDLPKRSFSENRLNIVLSSKPNMIIDDENSNATEDQVLINFMKKSTTVFPIRYYKTWPAR